MIKKEGPRKYVLMSKDGTKVLGRHTSEVDALRQERKIQIEKARAAGAKIPRR